jgi:hypothetical protein
MMFANLQGRIVPVNEKNSCKKDSQNEADQTTIVFWENEFCVRRKGKEE